MKNMTSNKLMPQKNLPSTSIPVRSRTENNKDNVIIVKKLRRDGCRGPGSAGIGDVSLIPGLYRKYNGPKFYS